MGRVKVVISTLQEATKKTVRAVRRTEVTRSMRWQISIQKEDCRKMSLAIVVLVSF
jgi:hypothetical protein